MNGADIIAIIVLSVVAIMVILQIVFTVKLGAIYIKSYNENETLKKGIKGQAKRIEEDSKKFNERLLEMFK